MNTSITLAQITSTTFTNDLKDLGVAYIKLEDNSQAVVFEKTCDGFTIELFEVNHNNIAKSKLLKTICLLDGVDLVQTVSSMIMEYNGTAYASKISDTVLYEHHAGVTCSANGLNYAINALITNEHAQNWFCEDLVSEYIQQYFCTDHLSESYEVSAYSGM